MKRINVTIVNYNVGNYASLSYSLKALGFNVRVSSEHSALVDSDIVILPGVGAFSSAMQELERLDLVGSLKDLASNKHPIIGICLGMQLLTECSYEHQHTIGLGIIPGEFVSFENSRLHIGWNTLEGINSEKNIDSNKSYYFNHSYVYKGPSKYQICTTTHLEKFASIIRNENTIGLQFHPEKSQKSGKELLQKIINEACVA